MSQALDLPHVARETLLSEAERVRRLETAMPQIESAVAGETDAVALQATLACLLFEALVQTNWCGFYRRVGERVLAVGPYQGTLGCLRIDFDRGVCGACARTGEVQLVADVSAVDHIACDPKTRSELVLPVRDHAGMLRAVLDLDSPHLSGFSRAEGERLEKLVRRVFADPRVVF